MVTFVQVIFALVTIVLPLELLSNSAVLDSFLTKSLLYFRDDLKKTVKRMTSCKKEGGWVKFIISNSLKRMINF